MSLGEMIPTSRPASTTRVRPSLQPSETARRLLIGSAGPAVDTLSTGQMICLINVVERTLGATFFRAVRVRRPLSRPAASWVGKVECLEAHGNVMHATGLLVLTLAGDRISAMTRFDNSVLTFFDLPRTLPTDFK